MIFVMAIRGGAWLIPDYVSSGAMSPESSSRGLICQLLWIKQSLYISIYRVAIISHLNCSKSITSEAR